MIRALTALFTVVLTALALGARGGPAQAGMVTVPGGELYHESKGVGRTVVLLHGGLLDCRMWDGQFELLAEHYHVVRYDARGHGRSSRIAGDFSRYRDLHALLTALDIPKARWSGSPPAPARRSTSPSSTPRWWRRCS